MARRQGHRKFFRTAGYADDKVLAAVVPYVRADVWKLYRENVESPAICPGEADCNDWKGASGDTHEAREQNACINSLCALFPTKIRGYADDQKTLKRLVESAREIRRRRESGYPMQPWEFGALEFETMLMIDELTETEEREIRRLTKSSLLAGFNLKVR